MYDLSARTGRYLHAPDDLIRLRYETGGTPRLFTVLIAQAVETDRIDLEGSGIVVLDEDEGRVLLDRHDRSDELPLGEELYRIRSMRWGEFSAFCREHPRFRGGPDDIITPHEVPLPGSRERQARLGADAVSGAQKDIRSALMIFADKDPSCPVRFPERDRDGVIRDLSERVRAVRDPLPYRLAWEITMPAAADQSGLSGDQPVDRSLDLLWEDLARQRPELLDEAWAGVLESLVGGRIATFGAQDEGRYDLRLLEAGEEVYLTLNALDGHVLRFESRDLLVEELSSMPSAQLRDLWKLSRTLDVKTGQKQVETAFQAGLNRVRSEIEAIRDLETAPSGP